MIPCEPPTAYLNLSTLIPLNRAFTFPHSWATQLLTSNRIRGNSIYPAQEIAVQALIYADNHLL